MTDKVLFGAALVALTVVLHVIGITWFLDFVVRRPALVKGGFFRAVGLLVAVAWWSVLLHIGSIGLWAGFFVWKKCLPNWETALYFSSTTYTTLGFGDVLLPPEWRIYSGVEALTGILMCGFSAAFFFAVAAHFIIHRTDKSVLDD